jgi:hypothetical protein
MKPEELLTRFENPGAEWRGKPFWAWNGKLEKAELPRQVQVMKPIGTSFSTARHYGPGFPSPIKTKTHP